MDLLATDSNKIPYALITSCDWYNFWVSELTLLCTLNCCWWSFAYNSHYFTIPSHSMHHTYIHTYIHDILQYILHIYLLKLQNYKVNQNTSKPIHYRVGPIVNNSGSLNWLGDLLILDIHCITQHNHALSRSEGSIHTNHSM